MLLIQHQLRRLILDLRLITRHKRRIQQPILDLRQIPDLQQQRQEQQRRQTLERQNHKRIAQLQKRQNLLVKPKKKTILAIANS